MGNLKPRLSCRHQSRDKKLLFEKDLCKYIDSLFSDGTPRQCTNSICDDKYAEEFHELKRYAELIYLALRNLFQNAAPSDKKSPGISPETIIKNKQEIRKILQEAYGRKI